MPMKVLILCAGYGTRLEQDLQNATKTSEQYRHLVGIPKPLLPIGERPLISHWIAQINESTDCDVDGIIIVVSF
jgi:NDP-sugar pyrophosphorylase family protein